jgi:hypothetical protein
VNREETEEVKRHFGIVAGRFDRKIQLIAEGVVDIHGKLDREMRTLREELGADLGELKAMMKFS